MPYLLRGINKFRIHPSLSQAAPFSTRSASSVCRHVETNCEGISSGRSWTPGRAHEATFLKKGAAARVTWGPPHARVLTRRFWS